MKPNQIHLILALLFFVPVSSLAQNIAGGQVHGSFQVDATYYLPDDKLGITDSSLNGNIFRMNSFGRVVYTNGRFEAGLRFEAYLPPLAGFDRHYEGVGIPNYYVKYSWDKLELTAGNFYEQFGSGLVLRIYEEWQLGIDNSIRGVRAKYKPFSGVTITGLYGVQRYFWEPYFDGNRGIVRAIDGEWFLNESIKGMQDMKTKFILGGSFVSNYEKDPQKQTVIDTTIYAFKLPRDVAAGAVRLDIIHGGFSLKTEYAYKINNPSAVNNYIYKNGEAFFLTLSYSKRGFGLMGTFKRVDNFSFKSNTAVLGNPLDINYLPAQTVQQVYSLATMYPYASQPNGEMGFQGQLVYTIPKKSKLGGRYGTKLKFDYSYLSSIDMQPVEPGIPVGQTGTDGYKSDFFKLGDETFYQEFNVYLSKKFNPKWKAVGAYINQWSNVAVVEGHIDEPDVHANIAVVDITYKITPKKSLRAEGQMLWTDQDMGNWAMALLEFNIAPHWFFTVLDEYNFGNPDPDDRLHYYNAGFAYVRNATRIALNYGRQREGLLCVGGVCRQVPASNGFTITVTSTF
jgi:hypothetical protein